jgi:hypothetical protein
LVRVWYAVSRTESLRKRHRCPSISRKPFASSADSTARSNGWLIACANRSSDITAARQPERGRVVDHLALEHRQLVEPGGDQRAERVGQLARRPLLGHHLGELLQEQRVAAAAIEQRTEQPLVGGDGLGRRTGELAEQLERELVALVAGERLQGAATPRCTAARPAATHLAAGSHRRDEHERQALHRAT